MVCYKVYKIIAASSQQASDLCLGCTRTTASGITMDCIACAVHNGL